MMSSVCTLRLKRRRAFSNGCPSWTLTSANTYTPRLFLFGLGSYCSLSYASQAQSELLTATIVVSHLRGEHCGYRCGALLRNAGPQVRLGKPLYSSSLKQVRNCLLIRRAMIRGYQGITPTIPVSCYVDESAQVIGDVV